MSYIYTVITYGGGQILTEIFNGVAAAVGTDSYMTIIGIASLMAFTWAVAESVFKQSFHVNLRWFVGFFLLYNIMLVPKVTVQVEDKINQSEINIIQNVPWGLAEFASDITQIFDDLTTLAETVYTLPNDLHYTSSGTVMASTLANAASRFSITDPNFRNNINSFMQQCVFYDLLLNKYTTDDLFNTTDLWDFFVSHASPARAFNYNHTIVTCNQGAQNLTQDWQQELKQAGVIYGSRFFPNNTQNPDSQLYEYLPISYSYLMNLSGDAQQIMQQLMVNNAMDQAVVSHAGEVGANAALQSYAYARSQQMKRSLYQVAGLQAGYWLPLMKIVFEAILIGSFIFLIPLMLMPFGWQVFKNFIFALVWVESWSPLYAILNLVMTFSAQTASMAATSSTQGNVLTMMTMPGLAQANFDISYLAGYLSLSIPVIAYYITRGSAQGLMSLAQYVGGAIQSSASHATQETTTGNFSYGNTNIDNHSAFNTNANHFDTNARDFSGAFTGQMPGGSALTVTPNGAVVMDNRGAISSLGTTVTLANSLREASTLQADQSWSAMVSSAHAYSDSMSAAIRDLYELGDSQGITQSSGSSSTMSEQSSTQTAASNLHQLINKFSQLENASHIDSVRALTSAYINAHVGINSNRSLEGKILGAITGLNGGISLGVKGEADKTWTAQHQNLLDAAKDYVANSNFTESVDTAIRGIKEQSFRANNEQGERLADNIGSSYDKAEQFRHDMSAQYQQAESYRNMASYAEENAQSINANATQPFLDWMKNQSAPGSNGPMGMNSVEYIMANKPQLAEEYAEQWSKHEADNLMQTFARQSKNNTSESIKNDYKVDSSTIPNESTLENQNQLNIGDVKQKAKEYGLAQDNIIDRSSENKVQEFMDSSSQSIQKESKNINEKGGNIKNENLRKLDD